MSTALKSAPDEPYVTVMDKTPTHALFYSTLY